MKADLIERLRSDAKFNDEWGRVIVGQTDRMREAADRIAALEAEASKGERLRAALHGIAHTFTEDSNGGMKTMSASYYQEIARRALIPEAPAREVWRPIETAPKDGTRILIWFVHASARYSDDPIGEGWAAAHEAYWLDHNGGGWTWHGLCGSPTHWRPLPPPPSQEREG